jgi:cyclopropane fatty-acyl-phospholipid synthase-like methyltransferase
VKFPTHSENAFPANDAMKNLAHLNDYFQVALDDIEADSIQNEGFEPICQRLDLATGEKLLDIGGELTIYAARKYATNVLGVTLNKPLHMKLNQCMAASGLLGGAVKFMDYRNLVSVQFDKAVCLDPFVTIKRKETVILLGTVYNLLHPGGLFLTQRIATAPPSAFDSVKQQSRLAQYIGSMFDPFTRNGFLPFNEVELIARQIGFEIHLAENLSENYRMGLEGWLTFLQSNRDEVVSHFSEGIFHHWTDSLSTLLNRIEKGNIQFRQYLFSKPGNSHNHVSLPDSQRCCGPRNSE